MVNDAGAWSREGREWPPPGVYAGKEVNKSRPVLGGFPICNRLAIRRKMLGHFAKNIAELFEKKKTTKTHCFRWILVRVLRFELRAS